MPMPTVFGKTIRQRAGETIRWKDSKKAALSILAHAWAESFVYDGKDIAFSTCAKIERIKTYVERAK